MLTESATFHEDATSEYEAAFDWYLSRSPDAALRFDAEVDRALTQIISRRNVGPQALTRLADFYSGSFPLP
jgi:hypothetical protein